MNKISLIENIILKAFAVILPWSIVLASPQFHIGYWGQVEGMISYVFGLSSIISIFLLKIGFNNLKFRLIFSHPLVLLPLIIGIFSIASGLFQRLPVMAFYGSPQIGQGAFWYFSIAILTALYFTIVDNKKWQFILLLNLLFVVIVVTVGSFYPALTGVVISFFGFNDWLALYYTSLFIFIYFYIETYKFPYQSLLKVLIFLVLGPLFWVIDNNSAIALWILVLIGWVFWLTLNKFRVISHKNINYLFNPIVFTSLPIILSIAMVISSYIFWDGISDQTDIITDKGGSWLGHLGTLVARGSIIRVLFEHLANFQALILGYGWGSISELLISSFTPEVFYQINTGNRVHFHTHNEIFEHIFSIGILGTFIYVIYTYYIFKYSFKYSQIISFLWLLYFCISAFWFQWVANIIIQSLLVALLLASNKNNMNGYVYKISDFFKAKLGYSLVLIFISLFLFYGSFIGYFTAKKHMSSFRSNQLIELAQNSLKSEKCSIRIKDFGKGALQFSQKFNGFNNYFKDQVMLYGKLNETDYLVLNWYLCASDALINDKQASLELINVHINVLSMISILPGEEGKLTRLKSKKYLNLWEDKLYLLLDMAPKRVDQATSLISYKLNIDDSKGVERICKKIETNGYYQGYCDLSLGAIYMQNN
ncbi:MAG: hypothetical protein CL734_00325, partial [Chloroflexi bacterium]|nr:hypothetical protein [Chloroflexota bacterium]